MPPNRRKSIRIDATLQALITARLIKEDCDLSLLQKQIERDLEIDGYFKKMTAETLIEVVREVALDSATTPAAAQLNLDLAEAK